MGLVDADLLSVQEARVLMERAAQARGLLEWMGAAVEDRALRGFRDCLDAQGALWASRAVAESDYGDSADGAELLAWVARDLVGQALEADPIHTLRSELDGTTTALMPRGVCVSLLPPLQTLPVLASHIVWAVKSRCPLVVSCPARVASSAKELFDAFAGVLAGLGFPDGAVAWLERVTPEGEACLVSSSQADFVIDGRGAAPPGIGAVVETGRGNNPVFVERTANVVNAARQIVASASFDCGALPGADGSLVVDRAVDAAFRSALQAEGCRFLDGDEARRVAAVLFDSAGNPRPEALAKPAAELARRAGVACAGGCRLLVAEHPYVSSAGAHVGACAAPFVTYYVEDDWREACQKCIELILAHGRGSCLAVFTGDEAVAREFVLRKPVSRVLVNSACGLGSCGRTARLPASLTLGRWRSGASTRPAVTREDFLSPRSVGFACPVAPRPLGNPRNQATGDPFGQLLCDLQPLRGEEER
ncbi:aldehyde dehydrogenase [Caniella muris]|uniref:aldehyde dehydrogenase n=1 Tax=Caniella muris TaxID=2941502 RepID=UPI00203EC4CA|nr:aldehyde dehydrogenase [Caniella muris]